MKADLFQITKLEFLDNLNVQGEILSLVDPLYICLNIYDFF